MPAAGRVDRQLANIGQTAARFRRAPHHHVEHLLFLEQTTNLNICQQGSCRATYITWFYAVALRCSEVDLDFQTWLLNWGLHVRINDTVDFGKGFPHLLCLAAEDLRFIAIEAHDDGVACSGHHLAASLVQIGLYLAMEPGAAVNHVPHGSHRLVIVGRRVEADPKLGGIDTDHLIPQLGASYLGSDVADTLNGPQLTTDQSRDPAHLRLRGA